MSGLSRVPELAPFQLMNLANEVYQVRQALCDNVRGGMGSLTLRDALSSSKIQQLLLNAGYKVTIGNLKALLKELGFNWNGASCSIQQLLAKLKDYLHPDVRYAQHNEY